MHTPSSLGIKRRLAIVPFRHSKLTEIFQSFFVGDGRAVMIVHVNPYDTGFDENSNVMKFSSIAQEISTVQTPRTTFPTLKKQISSQFSALRNAVTGHSSGQRIKVMVPVIPKPVVTAVNVNVTATSSFSRPTAASASRASTTGRASAIPTASRISRPATRPTSPQDTAPSIDGVTIVEEEIEVVEEDAEEEEDDEHDYLVDYLFEELKQLKTRVSYNMALQN
jgi:kinesin family protein 20